MKIIRNNYFPFEGFKAMNVFGVLFVRKGALLTARTLNHERIHSAQIEECMIATFLLTSVLMFMGLWWVTLLSTLLSFYLWYGVEWLVKRIIGGEDAYYRLSFEREAYLNEGDPRYTRTRKSFAWIKLL